MSVRAARAGRISALSVVALVGALGLTACSDPDSGQGSGAGSGGTSGSNQGNLAAGPEMLDQFSSIQKDDAIAAKVPAAVRQAGKLTVVMNVSSAPVKFYATDNTSIIGLNPDIARALGRILGLQVDIKDVQFDGIIPGLQAKRYDMAVSSMAPSPERVKVLDMVDYASWGTSLAVKPGNPAGVRIDSMCGHKIAVQQGSVQNTKRLPEYDQKCKAAGKGAIEQVVLPDQTAALLQLSTGRVDAVLADTPVLGWAAKQRPNTIDLVDEVFNAPVAVALPKNSPLTAATQQALQKLMSTPEYKKMLTKWGMSNAALTKAVISDGTS